MAAGGIIVSGQWATNGSLIHTNLLRFPILLDANGQPLTTPVVTVGCTGELAGYPSRHVYDGNPQTKLLTSASAGDIDLAFDLGTASVTVYGIVLAGHNLTASGITYAKLEGGTTTACADVSQALILNGSTLTPAYRLLATPVAKRYWRVRVKFTTSTALQVKEAFLIGAAPLGFAINYSWGGRDYLETFRTGSDGGIGGVPQSQARWVRRFKEMAFSGISTAQKDALEYAAMNGAVVLSPDGSSGPALFGVLEITDPAKEGQTAGQHSITVAFREARR